MVRVPAEDIKQVQADINGRRYTANRGWFEMPDADARVHLAAGNLPTPNMIGAASRAFGYRCKACGFGSYFTTCRCGGTCVREV